MPSTIGVNTNQPLHVVPEPSFDRIERCVATAVETGAREPAMIHAVLFVASAEHLADWGRPLHGETWVRGLARYSVFGVVTSAVIADRTHGATPTFAVRAADGWLDLTQEASSDDARAERRYRISESDVEAIQTAYDLLARLDAEAARETVRAQALYGTGADGTLVDWFDGLPPEIRRNPEHRNDLAWQLLRLGWAGTPTGRATARP